LVERYKLAVDRIIQMPQSSNEEELYEKSSWLAEIAKKKDLDFPSDYRYYYGLTKGELRPYL